MEHLTQHIESLIFSSDKPISIEEIKQCLEVTFETEFIIEILEQAIQSLIEQYDNGQFSFHIVEISGGYQFLSKAVHQEVIVTMLKQRVRRRLSKTALETLAIIAYKQPVSKGNIEKIRGVSCNYAVQKLLEKELVIIQGRSDGPGRPLLYGTGQKFMDYLGLKSLKDLPKPKDFKEPDNAIGEIAPVDETIVIENKA